MENTRNGASNLSFELNDWTKEETEELILLYLDDYYRTLKEEYLGEALQLARDEGVDIQRLLRLARSRLH